MVKMSILIWNSKNEMEYRAKRNFCSSPEFTILFWKLTKTSYYCSVQWINGVSAKLRDVIQENGRLYSDCYLNRVLINT